MKKFVSFLCAGVMLLSLAACGSTGGGEAAADTNITADSVVSTGNTGSTVTDADIAVQLADAVTLTFSDSGITADGSGVRVADSDCPTQDCVHTGRISRAGQSIVCLPAQVAVQLVGAATPDTPDVIVG